MAKVISRIDQIRRDELESRVAVRYWTERFQWLRCGLVLLWAARSRRYPGGFFSPGRASRVPRPGGGGMRRPRRQVPAPRLLSAWLSVCFGRAPRFALGPLERTSRRW